MMSADIVPLCKRNPQSDSQIVDMSWPDFKRYFYGTWHQGEHVSLIGPTGQGKTTLALEILNRRSYVVVLGTKVRDPTLAKLQKHGYKRIEKWADKKLQNRFLLWPTIKHERDLAKQRKIFSEALNEIYREGRWCVYVDEARYQCEVLKMRQIMVLLWTQGRSNLISLVAGCQRPAFVPTEIYDQATHLFFWGDNDETNLKRIGGVGFLNSKEIRMAVAALPKFHILYVNSRTGEMLRTKVELVK
jgi:ABC-type cobalamin/Fe3+-siderophores transport system ATPase subunit